MSIRRALVSVSDKTGLVEFARALNARGIELLSTGGTQKSLADAGIPVTSVESYTGSPEVMSGRVKTLHPRVHGGLLGREGIDDADLNRIGGAYIDLVVVNLYPFEQTLAKPDATHDELIENIDIGGPSMLRSAAKNHQRVTVVCDPQDYSIVLKEIEATGDTTLATRRRLAAKVFAHTSAYDGMITGWLSAQEEPDGYPRYASIAIEKAYSLRYGENPHQTGAFYRERSAMAGTLACSESLGMGAKELSYNNLVDVQSALDAVLEYDEPAAVVVKHNSPCGVAVASQLDAAYKLAREADSLSAYGGIVALNREVDIETANSLCETFLECIIAPNYSEAALAKLQSKKALRLLATVDWLTADHSQRQYRRVSGGFVVQDRDGSGSQEVLKGRVVTQCRPSPAQLATLQFAWLVCKHVKSNAIVLARQGQVPSSYVTTGIGGGQTARVTSVEIACKKADQLAPGSVLASDAFFPFADGVQAAAAKGVTAIAQPGGSKHDSEVIKAADQLGLAMVFTGIRHFRH
jgi:phosphoribosylaminoimidazolecarboxamide formyltransferase / IMP cyclohydrolase